MDNERAKHIADEIYGAPEGIGLYNHSVAIGRVDLPTDVESQADVFDYEAAVATHLRAESCKKVRVTLARTADGLGLNYLADTRQ